MEDAFQSTLHQVESVSDITFLFYRFAWLDAPVICSQPTTFFLTYLKGRQIITLICPGMNDGQRQESAQAHWANSGMYELHQSPMCLLVLG